MVDGATEEAIQELVCRQLRERRKLGETKGCNNIFDTTGRIPTVHLRGVLSTPPCIFLQYEKDKMANRILVWKTSVYTTTRGDSNLPQIKFNASFDCPGIPIYCAAS
jgi:hypothetical protein